MRRPVNFTSFSFLALVPEYTYGITMSIWLTLLTNRAIINAPLVLVDGDYRPRSRIIAPVLYVYITYASCLGNELVTLGGLAMTVATTGKSEHSTSLTCVRMILIVVEIISMLTKVSRLNITIPKIQTFNVGPRS